MLPVVSDVEIDDLKSRLAAARWPQQWPSIGAEAGVELDEVRRLATVWLDTFDWRRFEREMALLPWRESVIGDAPLQYLLFEGADASALPIVLTNGWPSTFFELVPLARRLSSPAPGDGGATASCTVVVPCLPGFAGSPQRPSVPADLPTHELWHRLMVETLGFSRYAAHGGDLGAGMTTRLAAAHPDEVAAIHLMAVADPPHHEPSTLTDSESAYLRDERQWFAVEGAYEHQQRTKPMTLAYGLSDSPVGLLAWLVEKYRGWSEAELDDDFILSQASLYWFTNSIGTSFRPYWEYGRDGVAPVETVSVPTAVALFPADLAQPPREWIERVYNLVRYTAMPHGGHFAPYEQTEALAADIREFLRTIW